jgi:hypothetical protein
MGKAARNRSRLRRLQEKRRRKEANRALWDARKASGSNSKRKLRLQKKDRTTFNPKKGLHLVHNCGNPGCALCYPLLVTNRISRNI